MRKHIGRMLMVGATLLAFGVPAIALPPGVTGFY